MKKMALLFFLLFAFTLAEAKVCMAAVLFQDDFSGNLNNWDAAAGTWSIENGELHGIGEGGGIDGWIYAGDESWTNYDFEAKVNMIEGGEVEFVFRSTGHWINEYRLSLWSLNGPSYENTFGLAKYKNGIVYPITNGNIPSPEPITDMLLGRVSVVDDKINIFINDEKIFEYQDNDPLLNGKIGLGVIWGLQARFDDVAVSGSSVIPEPSSALLLGLGGLLLRRFNRRKRPV